MPEGVAFKYGLTDTCGVSEQIEDFLDKTMH